MEFIPAKREIIRINRKKSPIVYPYKLHGTEPKPSVSAKYLGINISSDLNWKTHINFVISKANNTLKFIRRNIKSTHTKLKEKAHKTCIRPQLEYCCAILVSFPSHSRIPDRDGAEKSRPLVLLSYDPMSSLLPTCCKNFNGKP